MFKLGVFTDEISSDFKRALDVVEEFGLKIVELRGLPKWELKAIKSMLEDKGLTVAGIASGLFKCAIDNDYQKQIETLEVAIERAHFFGTNVVRCFAFKREEKTIDNVWDRIADKFDQVIQIAEREKVILALENENTCYVGTGKECSLLLSRINSPNLKSLWDPGNAWVAGEKPYPDGYKEIKDRLVHVHIKDVSGLTPDGKDGIWEPVGKGKIDWKGQIKALVDDGYNGIISLETHYVPEGGTQEQGSRESFDGLKGLLSSIGIQHLT
ncbi:sugar phosphate isomerase/epimerase [bacterium]|nr:sugar phosphate isomerase/epimerase [bacterium]